MKNIKKGIKVEIQTKAGKIIRGIVEDIGSRKEYHPDGILHKSINYVNGLENGH